MAAVTDGPQARMSDLQQRIQDRKKTQLELVNRKAEREQRAKLARGAERSLFILTRENPLRKLCMRLATSKLFDGIIIVAIIINSVIIGLSDFNVVDKQLNPASKGLRYVDGELVSDFSLRNFIVEISEKPSTILFACEAIIKIIAFGFVGGHGTYLRDSWNQLDFFVVVSSLVSVLPNIPNVSSIRTIRVLRPLRSLSMIPGMRRLISALLKALPALANVLILQLFVFAIFGILGIQLFGGNMNRRCRLTEYAVKLPFNGTEPLWPVPEDYLDQVLADPELFRCIDGAPMLDDGDPHTGEFTMETSPWRKPQDCFWPIDETDTLLCVVPGVAGNHPCAEGQTCGSDYDTYGNRRFTLSEVMDAALYSEGLNWGYTSFDHIGRAFFTIFQSITLEGWTVIMYMVMDGGSPLVGALFFVTLIIFASFFVMNLTLAVISDEFNIDEDEAPPAPSAVEQKAMKLAAEARQKLGTQREKPRFPTLFKIVSHPLFGNFIMVVILANTVVLALDHHPMPAKLDADLEMINFGLSCVFLVEMILKLLGLGFRLYAKDKFNLFDAFVVTMSVLETIASPQSFMTDETQPKKGAVSALRSFRLFRVFKLARDWGSFRGLLELIARAVASIGNFGVLLFLFIYIYALVGLQFFANTMRYDEDGYLIKGDGVDFWEGDLPRNNFDTLLWSAVTVFQVITGENWNNIMYDTMRGNGMAACVYFISLVVFGNFILMNLFLALLLDNFGDVGSEDDEARKVEEIAMLALRMSSMKVLPANSSARFLNKQPTAVDKSDLEGSKRKIKDKDPDAVLEDEPVNAIDLDHLNEELARELAPQATRPQARKMGASKPPPRNSQIPLTEKAGSKNRIEASPESAAVEAVPPTADKDFELKPPQGKLFFILDENNVIRQYAYKLIIHPWFDSLILVLIVISSISLALDNPLARPDSKLKVALAKMDTVFAGVFMVEMAAKILALGLITHEGSYLRKGWNVLDCLIVVSSIMMLIADSSTSIDSKKFKSLRSLRGLRTFRPLRMISRRPGLRLVVNALFEAIPKVLNVLFLCLLLYFIFSIIAVNYLKGLFYACKGDVFDALSGDQQSFLTHPVAPWSALTDDQMDWFVNTTCSGFSTLSGKITSRYVCECWEAEWGTVLPENFNNVGTAMLTFFEISTTEGWADVMMAAIDATDIDMQPIRDNNEAWAWFFVLFIMIGSFFVVNLFVGVIIDNFNKMKDMLGDEWMLSDDQKKWIEARKTVTRVVPVRRMTRPKHKVRGVAYDLVKKRSFEWFIIICIIINTVLMGVQYFGQPTKMIDVIGVINEMFAIVFTLESALKITAFGRAYFDDQWNNFDFFVVLGTLFSIIIEALTGASVRSLAMLVRVFRVTRIIRLVKASKSIRQILLTLYIALPGLSNITSILFLMLFIYATMGVQFFAKVKFTDNINSHANFQDFWTAFLLLLRAATGEAWNSCMHDLANTEDCVDDPPYDETMCGFNNFEGCVPINGCGSPIAFVYFCTFTLLVTYVMLNLTIAVILEGFSQSQSQDEEEEEPLFEPEMLDEFQLKWAEIDYNATGFMHVRKIRMLITLLEEPLGRKDVLTDRNAFVIYMRGLKLPVYEGDVIYFRDVLLAMAREMVKENVGEDPEASGDIPVGDIPSRLCMDYEAHEYYAVRIIEKRVRQWLDEKREFEQKAMEEYKSKIKKPSGRPKKQRDARVYTIG